MSTFEKCWLDYRKNSICDKYMDTFKWIRNDFDGKVSKTAVNEILEAFSVFFDKTPKVNQDDNNVINTVWLKKYENSDSVKDNFAPGKEGYVIYFDSKDNNIIVASEAENGILYGVFELIRAIQNEEEISEINIARKPEMPIRMINHWDNMAGDIERGYSGNSFFYDNNVIFYNDRIEFYAKIMASIGINAITINNVNVHQVESYLITDRFLDIMKKYSDLFTSYGIKLFLSVNYAAPMEIDGLEVSDPLDERVIEWWTKTSKHVYEVIPEFGGYLVKADSEGRPGPFTYGRTHADGANMLARTIAPYGGIVVWRCFVYNCRQDWRDKKTDRARAACDNFAQLDGLFDDNVILQIKNGPMDFQVREPVSPLFGKLKKTNMFLEVQAAQEYTGQQRHICYLIPMWKEILEFNTYASENGCINDIVSGKAYGNNNCGMAVVTNTGNDENWTGHDFAAANLFGYGLLCFDTKRSSQDIATQWAKSTFGCDKEVVDNVVKMLMKSWPAYEKYTVPLGIGWMCNPANHYGPNVDGYEYDRWGTYHRADCKGLGVDRSVATGTGYSSQYNAPWNELYDKIETTPEELLLFFHHVNYDYVLSTGKTLIQHIYDTHFEGVEDVEDMIKCWRSLEGKIDEKRFNRVMDRLNIQLDSSIEWRDRINTYFFRMSGTDDKKGRTIY